MALVFSDASFRDVDGETSFGFAIWVDGVWVHAGSREGPKVSSPKEAEAWTILCALKEAGIWCFRKIHLLSNVLEVIRAITGSMDWFIHPIWLDIRELRSPF